MSTADRREGWTNWVMDYRLPPIAWEIRYGPRPPVRRGLCRIGLHRWRTHEFHNMDRRWRQSVDERCTRCGWLRELGIGGGMQYWPKRDRP